MHADHRPLVDSPQPAHVLSTAAACLYQHALRAAKHVAGCRYGDRHRLNPVRAHYVGRVLNYSQAVGFLSNITYQICWFGVALYNHCLLTVLFLQRNDLLTYLLTYSIAWCRWCQRSTKILNKFYHSVVYRLRLMTFQAGFSFSVIRLIN